MSRRTAIYRGDLLRALGGKSTASLAGLSALFGFEAAPTDAETPATTPEHQERQELPPPPPPPPSTPQARLEFLQAVRAETRETMADDNLLRPPPPLWVSALASEPRLSVSDCSPTWETRIAPRKLLPWTRLWPFLQAALGFQSEGTLVNLPALVRTVAEGRPVNRIPRRTRLSWARSATVLLDGRPSLALFRDDFRMVVNEVIKWRGKDGLRILWTLTGNPAETEPDRRYHPSPAHWSPSLSLERHPVLALSDLGCLGGDQEIQRAWINRGRLGYRSGQRCCALLPCPRDRWAGPVIRHWISAAWDFGERPLRTDQRSALPRPKDDTKNESAVESLLTAMVPSVRCEPELLRELHWSMRSQGVDIGTEFDVWNHAACFPGGVVTGLRPEAAIARRETFRKLDLEIQRKVVRALWLCHTYCSPSVRASEVRQLRRLGLDPETIGDPAALEAEDFERRLLATLISDLQTGNRAAIEELGLAARTIREGRRSDASWKVDEVFARQYAAAIAARGLASEELPEGVDRESVAAAFSGIIPANQRRVWELRQVGHRLRFLPTTPATPGALPPDFQPGSPLAWLPSCRDRVVIECKNSDKVRMMTIDLTASPYPIDLSDCHRITIQSDLASVEVALRPPVMGSIRQGHDGFGHYTDFEIKGVRFTMRWMPPGSFWMGSPEDEPGRWSDEGPRHQVTLTEGFWLGATTVTQSLWKAVMRKNLSRSKVDFAPVDSVDWRECSEFCQKLEALIPGVGFRLPTEAEWEYACRAGTESAFNDGSPCSLPDRKDTALAEMGWHGEGEKGKPHPVAQLTPNPWGLYDMHGNVWEWCLDGKRSYQSKAESDPVGPMNPGASRVLRGGSYWYDAGNCRSASRSENDPGDQSLNVGFRLAAGQPVRERSPGV